MAHGNVTSKFGEFVDPHDIAVTSDAKEVGLKFIIMLRISESISLLLGLCC